jgi:tetratricopeptide (TPR) repeat protein
MEKYKKIFIGITALVVISSLTINIIAIYSNFTIQSNLNKLSYFYANDTRFIELQEKYNFILGHLLYLKGKDAIRYNRLEEAENLLEKAIETDPKISMAHFELATLMLKKNETIEALNHSEIEAKNNPSFVDNLNLLGTLQYLHNRFQDASLTLEKALLLKPDSRDAVNNLSETYRQLLLPDKAQQVISDYQKNILKDNADPILEYKQRMALLQSKKFDDAIRAIPEDGSDDQLSTLALSILAAHDYIKGDLKKSNNRLNLAKAKDQQNILPTLLRDKNFEHHPWIQNSIHSESANASEDSKTE